MNNSSKQFSAGAWLVMAAFGQFVPDETDLEALMAELLRVTKETMQPEQVSIWLKET